MPVKRFLVTLSCRSRLTGEPHTLTFTRPAPSLGERVWCARCAAMATVVVAPDDWRLRCKGCPYGSRHGASKDEALRAITRHVRKHPTHAVQLRNGKYLIDTINPQTATSETLESLLGELGDSAGSPVAPAETEAVREPENF